MIREARLQSLDPERAAFLLADSLAFDGHPYAISPAGTESSLSSLSADIVRRYVSDEFVTSRMLLVVVGNIPRARLEPLITATLGTLPPGSYRWTIPPDVPRRPSSLTFVPRRIHTNYIVGYFAGPPVTSKDYAAFRIATAILSSRLASAIRYNADLSYCGRRAVPRPGRRERRVLCQHELSDARDGAHAAAARFDEESAVRLLRAA